MSAAVGQLQATLIVRVYTAPLVLNEVEFRDSDLRLSVGFPAQSEVSTVVM